MWSQALLNQLPAVASRAQTEHGLLVGYDNDPAAIGRGSVDYIDRIFKGANPTEMPIQQPTKFLLPINLKTARGITIPPEIMLQATEFIE